MTERHKFEDVVNTQKFNNSFAAKIWACFIRALQPVGNT